MTVSASGRKRGRHSAHVHHAGHEQPAGLRDAGAQCYLHGLDEGDIVLVVESQEQRRALIAGRPEFAAGTDCFQPKGRRRSAGYRQIGWSLGGSCSSLSWGYCMCDYSHG